MGLNVSFMPVPELLMRKRLRDTCYEDFRGFSRRGTLSTENTHVRVRLQIAGSTFREYSFRAVERASEERVA